ncbi:hypothetical protein VP01_2404g4 [Puccinia sorghi]|uniref:Uncharacterized protein n=1 Tax=Puccinia sorghi TaxID=27349 RepID=A0A0L6V8J5_9BASI|nr:hypothetical protein VP01_2404g4 [Puccinia sorghi]
MQGYAKENYNISLSGLVISPTKIKLSGNPPTIFETLPTWFKNFIPPTLTNLINLKPFSLNLASPFHYYLFLYTLSLKLKICFISSNFSQTLFFFFDSHFKKKRKPLKLNKRIFKEKNIYVTSPFLPLQSTLTTISCIELEDRLAPVCILLLFLTLRVYSFQILLVLPLPSSNHWFPGHPSHLTQPPHQHPSFSSHPPSSSLLPPLPSLELPRLKSPTLKAQLLMVGSKQLELLIKKNLKKHKSLFFNKYSPVKCSISVMVSGLFDGLGGKKGLGMVVVMVLVDFPDLQREIHLGICTTPFEVDDRLLTGECTKVRRLKIIPQLGKPLASPGGGYKIITHLLSMVVEVVGWIVVVVFLVSNSQELVGLLYPGNWHTSNLEPNAASKSPAIGTKIIHLSMNFKVYSLGKPFLLFARMAITPSVCPQPFLNIAPIIQSTPLSQPAIPQGGIVGAGLPGDGLWSHPCFGKTDDLSFELGWRVFFTRHRRIGCVEVQFLYLFLFFRHWNQSSKLSHIMQNSSIYFYTDCNEQTKSGKHACLHSAEPSISLFRAIKHFHDEVTHRATVSPNYFYLSTKPLVLSIFKLILFYCKHKFAHDPLTKKTLGAASFIPGRWGMLLYARIFFFPTCITLNNKGNINVRCEIWRLARKILSLMYEVEKLLWLRIEMPSVSLKKKLAQLPAVDMQHSPAKLPSKLHMFAYVDFWAHMHSNCAVCTVTVHQSLVESILENGWSNNRSLLGDSACQMWSTGPIIFGWDLKPISHSRSHLSSEIRKFASWKTKNTVKCIHLPPPMLYPKMKHLMKISSRLMEMHSFLCSPFYSHSYIFQFWDLFLLLFPKLTFQIISTVEDEKCFIVFSMQSCLFVHKLSLILLFILSPTQIFLHLMPSLNCSYIHPRPINKHLMTGFSHSGCNNIFVSSPCSLKPSFYFLEKAEITQEIQTIVRFQTPGCAFWETSRNGQSSSAFGALPLESQHQTFLPNCYHQVTITWWMRNHNALNYEIQLIMIFYPFHSAQLQAFNTFESAKGITLSLTWFTSNWKGLLQDTLIREFNHHIHVAILNRDDLELYRIFILLLILNLESNTYRDPLLVKTTLMFIINLTHNKKPICIKESDIHDAKFDVKTCQSPSAVGLLRYRLGLMSHWYTQTNHQSSSAAAF